MYVSSQLVVAMREWSTGDCLGALMYRRRSPSFKPYPERFCAEQARRRTEPQATDTPNHLTMSAFELTLTDQGLRRMDLAGVSGIQRRRRLHSRRPSR